MTPEQWQQAREILADALELKPEDRPAFLSRACSSDSALRQDVERLLASSDEARSSFLQSSAFRLGPTPGARLGEYEVQSLIGAGGMGEVYRAQDKRLGREVAIKVLPAFLSHDPDRLRRFEQEARAAAALNHPNILAVFQMGTYEGAPYLVSELLEGGTLRELLVRGSLPVRKATDYGVQTARGLAAAHEKGITHRDLKPENLFVTKDGRVKILDFGLAKLTQRPTNPDQGAPTVSVETEPGVVMGTVGYMAPEQVRGKAADHRADIFAFGAILYEMLTGKRAFNKATTAETMTAILNEDPQAISQIVPFALQRVVLRCMEKSPEQRFQSASDLGFALEPQSVEPILSTVLSAEVIQSIAVLPFENASGEPNTEYLCDGITESIINSLSQLPGLRVMPRSVVFRYKQKDVDAQAVGRELNARAVLMGRIMQRGENLVVGTELVDAVAESQLWGERYNRKLADIFAVEEEIARRISESLRMKLTRDDKGRLAKRFTQDAEAYQLYLKGRYHWVKRTPDSVKKALEYFEQAIQKDADYALAYAGLADCYTILSFEGILAPNDGLPEAKAAAAKAVAIDDALAEGHTSLALAVAHDRDWLQAENEFRRALELNPGYWIAHSWYGLLLAGLGRREEAIAEVLRAEELEPLMLAATYIAAWIFYLARQYDQTIARCRKALEIEPNYGFAHYWLALAQEQKGKHKEAIAELKKAVHLLQNTPFALAALGHAQAAAGHKEEAQKLLDELIELSRQRYAEPFGIAEIHVALNERNQAFDWLQRAFDERSLWFNLFLNDDPRLDSLRSDPRFRDLLHRTNLQA